MSLSKVLDVLLDNFVYVFVLSVVLLALCIPILDRNSRIEQANNLINSGAKVYLDGREVDPDFVVLGDYRITIRDNVVILSK